MFAATGKAGSPTESAVAVGGWLSFAATPIFALMAWISAIGSSGTIMCTSVSAVVPINDMALMYLLMGIFHLSPWLKLLSGHSRPGETPVTQTEGE